MKLTAGQQKAMEKVRAALANPVYTYSKKGTRYLATGANCQTMQSLHRLGMIDATMLLRRGVCSTDLRIVGEVA